MWETRAGSIGDTKCNTRVKSRPDSASVGGAVGSSAITLAVVSPRHCFDWNAAIHFTAGSHGGASSRSTHFGQRGFFGSGFGFAQQQFAVASPQGMTHPQAFTVYFVWITGKPNDATVCANTSATAINDRSAGIGIRGSRIIV
jgi:hypothetical protein